MKDCLSALSLQTYSPYEVIFVDNGSIDGSIDFVRENFSWVRICKLPENRGFSGGNLEGLKECRGEFIALVNNDTRADGKWLENLVEPMRVDSTIGICASKLIVDGTEKINSAGDGLTTAGSSYNRGLWQDRTSYERPGLVFGACGGAGLYRQSMLEEIGFLDDDFFLYHEDADLNFRAQLAGWKCFYVPKAVVYHRVNGTTGGLTDLTVYHHARNMEFVWIKNMPIRLMMRFAHHKLIQELSSFCYLCLRHGKWKAFFKGKRDALRLLPKMLQKRRDIQRTRKVNDKILKTQLTSIFSKKFVAQKIRQFLKE